MPDRSSPKKHICLFRSSRMWFMMLMILDDFITLAEQKQLIEDGRVSEQVCLFFSRFNLIDVANSMAQGVQKIRMILDSIAVKDKLFHFGFKYSPIRKRSVESYSCIGDDFIIGREDDVSHIIDMLADPDAHQGVSFLSVVGTGGLGKTSLVRLVYNHERVANAFPLRLWTCVSEQDPHHFDIKQFISNIEGRSAEKMLFDTTYEILENNLMEKVAGRKFLLVVDDVWIEKHDEWLKLAEFLRVGKRGSWIVVTTRSRETAKMIGNGPIYELQGLSKENSWCLFERVASFEQATLPDDLAKIGRDIVKVCNGVPLAIRVVGTLLCGQGKSNWQSFQEIGLTKIRNCKNNIIPLLKLSFEQLEPSLQCCFSHCALFPKNFEMEKEMLINLWMAQGFVVPLDKDQTIEDAGEEYFSILLQRCFLEVARKDEFEFGEIVSCKMCSPMHDIAQEFAGKEICAVNSTNYNLDSEVRHLSVLRIQDTRQFTKTQIRTYLEVDVLGQLYTDELLNNWTCLRTLVLRGSVIRRLPDSIGNLTHLRCLELSYNSKLEMLPESVTTLHNLQRLVLKYCIMLKELPRDLSKLVKLKVLDIEHCHRLTSIPSDLHKLTCLQTLSKFELEASSSLNQWFDKLEGLKALVNLRGHLGIPIKIPRNLGYVGKGGIEGSYLKNKDRLIDLWFFIEHVESEARGDYEALLEDLQPHSNLKGLMFFVFGGVKLPSWASDGNLATFLPNLVKLQLSCCQELQDLPNLGSLHHLKILSISNIPNLEYMDSSEQVSSVREPPIFSCLEELNFYKLPKLKQWCKGELIRDDRLISGSNNLSPTSHSFPSFPQLKILNVRECQEMIFTLLCPRVEVLELHNVNRNLRVSMTMDSSTPKFLSLNTDDIEWFNPQPREVCQRLIDICVSNIELESLSQAEEVFRSCSSSLQKLTIFNCFKLKSLSGGLEHLTALDTLILDYLPSLLIDPEEEEKGMPWRCLTSLRSLELKELTTLENLPSGMQYLTNLHILKIVDCLKLQSLPKWIPKLTSLWKLDVGCCYSLYETCQNPDGEDWPYIQHIPHVSVTYVEI